MNVLVHAAEVKLTGKQLASIMKLKERHHVQDLKEIFGMKKKFDRVQPAGYFTQNGTSSARVSTLEDSTVEDVQGGDIWDVFRREDVPKLRGYLNKHFREFRHIHCSPVPRVNCMVTLILCCTINFNLLGSGNQFFFRFTVF